jgi:hypothetical protein
VLLLKKWLRLLLLPLQKVPLLLQKALLVHPALQLLLLPMLKALLLPKKKRKSSLSLAVCQLTANHQ